MSITVKNLTKIYGEQKAVDNISFTVNKGEIVGFLGPNGAGVKMAIIMIHGSGLLISSLPARLILVTAPHTKIKIAMGPRAIQINPKMRFSFCIEICLISYVLINFIAEI